MWFNENQSLSAKPLVGNKNDQVKSFSCFTVFLLYMKVSAGRNPEATDTMKDASWNTSKIKPRSAECYRVTEVPTPR